MSWLKDQLLPDHVVDVETSNGQNGKCTSLSWVLERMREALASSHLALHMVSLRHTASLPSYFVPFVHRIAHVDDNETRGLRWFHGTRSDRFEIDLEVLRQANDELLRSGPTVTLCDLQCKVQFGFIGSGHVTSNAKHPCSVSTPEQPATRATGCTV